MNYELVSTIVSPGVSKAKWKAMEELIRSAERDNFNGAVNWIDRQKDRFWCPLCEKNQSHPAVFSAWASPEPECKPVCCYGICKRCASQGESFQKRNQMEGFQRLLDLAERRLITRYPHLAANLPAGYFDQSIQRSDLGGANVMIPNPIEPHPEGQAPTAVAYRRYLVIRFMPALELQKLQPSIIWKLGETYPLTMVCNNGEEPPGLEAWFKTEGWTEDQCRALMNEACTYGADPETFDPLCYVCLPGAINPRTGKVQKCIYLDPEGKNFPSGPTPLSSQRPPKK
jgi:hypothetical protein